MRISPWAPFVVLGFVLLALMPAEAKGKDPYKDFKSKNYRKRLKAVAAIRAAGGDQAEKVLISALKDADWEVRERAAEALAEHGKDKALKALVNVAIDGPIWRVRRAAAHALARMDIEDAAKRLSKYVRREQGVKAVEALSILARTNNKPADKELLKALSKAVKFKEPAVRAAAADALVAFPVEERVKQLNKLLDDEAARVRAAALVGVRDAPALAYLSPVAKRLTQPKLGDVLTRRAIAAMTSIVASTKDEERKEALGTLEGLIDLAGDDAAALARVARLLGSLASPRPAPKKEKKDDEDAKKDDKKKDKGDEKKAEDEKPPPPLPPTVAPDAVLPILERILTNGGAAARAEAVRSLRRIGTKEAIDRAGKMVEDPHARVRIQALEAIAAGTGLTDAEAVKRVSARLKDDKDAAVREQAAVLLGRTLADNKPFDAPVAALTGALKDPVWSVAVAAAVSLGKTRSEEAIEPLAKLLDRKAVKDWRVRGAAVVGLGKLRQKAAVPHLISALRDRDAWVKRNAHEFLKRLSKREIMPDASEWNGWWDFNKEKFEFPDRDQVAREAKTGAYGVEPKDVYKPVGKEAQDVVVLQSREDHFEQLLHELDIEFRMTRATEVAEAEGHSFAVFVVNSSGEIQKDDIERLQWFVRVGGYLFASSKALQHTVEKVYPGMVQRLPTKAEVQDNVRAGPCADRSPRLDGVFHPWCRSIYALFGSHLIQVIQPERVEVLVDSPHAAELWGDGNMAAWFPAGHGVIVDSVNYFDLQGLERVTGLKKPEDRMAYAIDHCGMDYQEVRSLALGRVWDRHTEAVKMVRDFSAFRLITNFVRLKRKTDS